MIATSRRRLRAAVRGLAGPSRAPHRHPIGTPRQRHRRAAPWDIYGATALGGAAGALGRWGVAAALPIQWGHFPLATFIVNTAGTFLLGVVMVFVLDVWRPTRLLQPFLAVGVLGGFTTFSTCMTESGGLLAGGFDTLADSYLLDTLAAGLFAAWLGIAVGRSIARVPVRRRPARRSPQRRKR